MLSIHWGKFAVPTEQLPNPRLELDPTSQPIFRENRWWEVRVHSSASMLAHGARKLPVLVRDLSSNCAWRQATEVLFA